MQTHVYANGRAVASKAADGQATAAFPDPCWSPPGPGAGPVLVPYPNTVHARDITNGTVTVFVCGAEVALADQSFFAHSTGNEGATRAFDQGAKSGVIQGKAYFQSWSFDVVFEGRGVARHQDLTTHNHGSKPGNTPPTYYLDRASAKPACHEERSQIKQKCKPEPRTSHDTDGRKKRKPGLSGALGEAADALDTLGRTSAHYQRDRSTDAFTGNAWMDDHCSGLWITPQYMQVKDLDKSLEAMLKKLEESKLSLMTKALDDLKDVAIQEAGQKAADKVAWLSARSLGKAVVGALGLETGVVPWAMGAWTAADLLSTARELAAMAGPRGEAALEAMNEIRNIRQRSQDILNDLKTNPHKAHANAMSLMAQIDPCIRARKCMLVPYRNTTGVSEEFGETQKPQPLKARSQARHGNGCCPGQTGHHIIPHAMVKDAGCTSYDYQGAPTICMEGVNNAAKHGSHGKAHANAQKAVIARLKEGMSKTISYEEAKDIGIRSIAQAGAAHCSRICLEAQLDAHYQTCKDHPFTANSGTGGIMNEPPKALPKSLDTL
jgi:hypothetical protein